MDVHVFADAEALAVAAAELFRARVAATPGLSVAVPAGRTPRRMYALMHALQADAPVDFTRMRVFCVDELCPPAPVDGYFWRQIQKEFVSWTGVPSARCRPFAVDAADRAGMWEEYEAARAEAGGLDLAMLGRGLSAHSACPEARGDFQPRTVTGPPEPETHPHMPP